MGNRLKSQQGSDSDLKLSQEELEFLEKHSSFKRDELINFHKSFIQDCPSGEINRKKFNSLMRNFRSIEEGDTRIDKYSELAFNAFDMDGNGYINFKEFMVTLSITSFGDLEKKIEVAFSLFDINRNKRIEKWEMEKVLKSLYEVANGKKKKDSKDQRDEEIDHYISSIMERADKNKDGKLSYEEFKDACLNDKFVQDNMVNQLFI